MSLSPLQIEAWQDYFKATRKELSTDFVLNSMVEQKSEKRTFTKNFVLGVDLLTIHKYNYCMVNK